MSNLRQWYLAVVVAWLAVVPVHLGCSRGSEGEADPGARPGGAAGQRQVFAVEGMTCEGCVSKVTATIEGLPGVAKVEVSLAGGRAVVVGDPEKVSAQAVIAAIAEAGYKAAAAAPGGNGNSDKPTLPTAKRGVLVNITRGKSELHAVSMAIALSQKALDDGRRCGVFLNVAAPVFAAKDLSDDVKYADFPPVKQMLAKFMADGGKLYVCEHCAHVCGMEDDDLIDGITLSRQAELFVEIDQSVAVFSY